VLPAALSRVTTLDMTRDARVPAIAALVIATALMTAACVAWGHSFPGPGDRPLASSTVIMTRSLAIALGAAAQGVAIAFALPRLVRPAPVYPRAAVALGAVSVASATIASLSALAR
jgi:hypothetical protein